MQVESDFTKDNTPQVSNDFRQYIFKLAEDIVLYSGSFEKKKKNLRARCEREIVNYNTLEYNLTLFFELVEDYSKSNDQVLYRFLKLQAGFCFIEVTDFVGLQIASAGQANNGSQSSDKYRNKNLKSTSSNQHSGIVGGHLFGLD